MTSDGNAARPRRIRVLVELAVKRQATSDDIFRTADHWKSTRFVVDRTYSPVPIRPARERVEETTKAGMRVVIVRGTIEPDQIADLERQANVRKVSPDTRLEPFQNVPRGRTGRAIAVDCDTTGEPIGSVKRLVKELGVDRIWRAGYRGENIVVGVVDAGITAHGRPVSFGESPVIPKAPAVGLVVDGWPDDWGTTAVGWGQHGNMMAFDIQAVAPAAALWDLRIFEPGANFGGYLGNALAVYRAAIDAFRIHGTPHILSNSWGLYDSTVDPIFAFDPNSWFARTVEEALDEGMLVLFAAGNCGAACPSFLCGAGDIGPDKSILGPNGHPRVMTVGAANLDDDWCAYTSQGRAALPPKAAKPDVCAYTRFDGFFPSADASLRDFDGGTSAATAVAAGVVALLKQRQPGLTQEEVKEALRETAEDIWAPGFDLNSGAGIIRAKAAFDWI